MPSPIDATTSPTPLLKQLAPDLPEATSDSACSALPPDLVKFDGNDTTNALQRYSQSINSFGAGTPTPTSTTLTASVQQADRSGQLTSTDLSKVRATKIEVKFRTARPEFLNAQHAYIEITRANGSKQDLAAYPKGGFPKTSEGGQLQFQAGNEKAANDPRSRDLHATKLAYQLTPPSGQSLTDYANNLVDGAKQYNAHAVRYDPIAQQPDRFNSNSFVSSLIVAKGGVAGLNDVRNLGNELDSGPVTVAGQRPAINDKEMAERVRVDSDHQRLIATGFSNAGIEPGRFERSRLSAATPPPIWKDSAVLTAGVRPYLEDFAHRAIQSIRRLWQHSSS